MLLTLQPLHSSVLFNCPKKSELFGESQFGRQMVYKCEAIECTPHVPKTRTAQNVPITRMSMMRRVKEQ